MFSKISFSNFYSFYEETEVSFEVGKKPSHSYYDIDLPAGTRINKVIAISGANGSGKTQLLRPFAFLSWFITKSFVQASDEDQTIAFNPHKLHQDEESTFALEFYIGEEKYRYKLVATKEKVIHESLFRKTSHLYSYIFTRDIEDALGDSFSYKYKTKGFDFAPKQESKVKHNVSFLCAADAFGSVVARKIVKYFNNVSFNINSSGRDNFHESDLFDSAEFYSKNKKLSKKAVDLICQLDLGLSSVKVKKVKGHNEKGNEETLFMPVGVHGSNEESFELPFFEESSGTKAIYVLLRQILPVLESGGLAVLDEIDNDLHLHMLIKVIEMFKFKHTNPYNAQLIFTCHSNEILNTLKKHQLYLVEKIDNKSESWRLDEVVGLRADDNIYGKYQAGALGGIPNF
ncbi:AAA family ATPase [Shewanella kaireitica]|uniref:AAA family ATPase n=1 Tax=Shewanella kaireitica TaxID=212021 RepID=UPI00200D004B|nr:ATP-binding protein [Shewanella kaireitica]MCL1095984.1 ATP-binding protein [Shewanella kaireitica]